MSTCREPGRRQRNQAAASLQDILQQRRENTVDAEMRNARRAARIDPRRREDRELEEAIRPEALQRSPGGDIAREEGSLPLFTERKAEHNLDRVSVDRCR